MWVLDFVTSPSFGVLVALLVIVGIHYRAAISRFISSLIENGIQETLLDCFLALCDLARAFYQIVTEILRNIFSSWGARRSASLFHTKSSRRVSNGSRMPPLVVIAEMNEVGAESGSQIPKNADIHGSSSSPTSGAQQMTIHFDDIEPAFLNDEDYPEGWLTYHRVLGVVSKVEADEFNRIHSL
jgi:hypothetical protein